MKIYKKILLATLTMLAAQATKAAVFDLCTCEASNYYRDSNGDSLIDAEAIGSNFIKYSDGSVKKETTIILSKTLVDTSRSNALSECYKTLLPIAIQNGLCPTTASPSPEPILPSKPEFIIGAQYTTAGLVFLKKYPSQSLTSARMLSKGATVEVLDKQLDSDGLEIIRVKVIRNPIYNDSAYPGDEGWLIPSDLEI